VIAPSRCEPGCLFFDVLLSEQDPLLVRFYEAYRHRSDFEVHLQTQHARTWTDECLPVVDSASIQMPESTSDHGGTHLHDRKVVVFGATGRIGREMVKRLAEDLRCKEVRAVSRQPESAAGLHLQAFEPSVQVLPFDDLEAVCREATDAFIVAPASDDALSWHEQVADALRAAKVEHVVKVSVIGARSPASIPPPGRFPSLHWAGEEALRSAGLKTTVIRPNIFMQHFEMGTGVYTAGDDRFYLPIGDAGVAFLDCRDIAATGHALLLSPSATAFHGGCFDLTGPEALTGPQIAAALSAVRGATVVHVDGIAAFEARCALLGKPDWPKAVYSEAAAGWFSALSTASFEAVVGRRPRSFAAWADDRASFFSATK
jgi:uncharacterized protein YbjT (DUF2867 family)